ncbi:MAG: hypothetical protein HKN03_02340 [Acidimicrobiales bacterium]|nr:hypothetical protein [Acidimicrobiales bacterium]
MLGEHIRTILRSSARSFAQLPAANDLFRSEFVRQIRKRFYRISPTDLAEVATALDDGGVRWWVTGGWGVDLLLGRQTRPHNDVDIWIDAADDGEARAAAALAELGYEVAVKRAQSGRDFPVRSVLRHRSGRIVDLIMVTTSGIDDFPALEPSDLGTGVLHANRTMRNIPCASATTQVRAHTGYKPQERDHHDMTLLCEHAGLELPPAYTWPRDTPDRSPLATARRLIGEGRSRLRGSTALLFLVPEAQDLFDAVGGATPGGIPAHITVLYPFIRPPKITSQTRDELAQLAAATDRFEVTITSLAQYEITTYLNLEPEEPIRTITYRIFEQWPNYPPYGDIDLYIQPHMALAQGVIPSDVESTALPHLPVNAEITHLTVMVRRWSGRWKVDAQFPLRNAGQE